MSANAAPLCPVCQRLDQGAVNCRQCGARLYSSYIVGAPPPSAQRELDDSMAAERRRYTQRVAARAAAWSGRGTLPTLAGLADGDTRAAASEIKDAMAAYDQEEPQRPVFTGVGFTLSRLVASDTDAIIFVEISPEGIWAYALVADELGVPRPEAGHESGGQVRWTDLLAELPTDNDLRLYLLAGGIGDSGAAPTASGARLTALVTAAAEREVARVMRVITDRIRDGRFTAYAGHDVGMALPPLARPDAVLVCRTRRWPPLEAAAAKVRVVLRPVAEIFAPGNDPLPAVVSEAARRAPLRYDYCLVLAVVDQKSGIVRPDARLLFPAGMTGQQRVHPTVDTAVMAPPTAADRLVLPVVARRGADPAGWPAVGVGIMDGMAAGITQLRIRLEAPGRVRMSALPKLIPGDGSASWPGVLAGLPARQPVPVTADVVLLAELGGRPETIAHRMSLLEKVVRGLDLPGVKVAIVGYREHGHMYGNGNRPAASRLVVGSELGDTADVRPILDRQDLWEAVEIRDRFAAPLEDALNWIAEQDLAWRPAARHLLVVFASRPPHPDRVDDRGEERATPCQDRLSWHDTLDWLRQAQRVECMAVLPEREAISPAGGHAERAWAELGAAGLFCAERSPTADLLNAMGIHQVEENARLPLAVGAPDV